ncbi:MAG: DUF302 domain-containing protein [Desulfobacterales bacterium]
MPRMLISFFIFFGLVAAAAADNGLVNVKSPHTVKETADRLEQALKAKEMTVFIRIDHAAGAQKAGLRLPPTEVVIFGNPKVGTPLMQCSRSVAIDLPQKALIWEDDEGQTWLTYNDPAYLAARHAISGCEAALEKVGGALRNFAAAATKP